MNVKEKKVGTMPYAHSIHIKQSGFQEEVSVPEIAKPHAAYPHALIYGDLLFLSGVGPREADSISFSPAFERQCGKVLENVEAILNFVRTSHNDVSDIKLVDVAAYFTDLSRKQHFEVEFRKRFPAENPCLTYEEIVALPGKIQIEMKVLAQIVRHNPNGTPPNLIFVGGEQTENPPGDFVEQFDLVFKNLKVDLEREGSALSNVLDVEVYMKDLAHNWRTYNEAYSKHFKTAPRPVRTTIGVKSLPHDWAIQMKATAWTPGHQSSPNESDLIKRSY